MAAFIVFLRSVITTRDLQGFPGQPGGIRRSKEDCGCGDVLGLADSAKRSLGLDLLAHVALSNSCSVNSFSLNHSRIDGINSNSTRPQLLCQCPGYRVNRTLGSTINRCGRNAKSADYRTNVNDASPIVSEILNGFLRREQQTENVQIELFVKVFLVNSFKRRELVNACVVHQNINLTECFLCLIEQSFDVTFFGDISLHRHSLSALAGYLANDALRPLSA